MIEWDITVDDIARTEPGFRDDVTKLLAASVYDWRVIYGYRSLALQSKLFAAYQAGGPKAAPAGESAHNYGLAVDVQLWVPVHANLSGAPPSAGEKVMEWNVKAPGWQWLFAAVFAAPRLHSGIGFGDFDHIERVDWRAYKGWNTPGAAT